MQKSVIKHSKSIWELSARFDHGEPPAGTTPVWYEAYLTSSKANEAFRENLHLEFGDETDWSPDTLKKCGAFDDLLKAATGMVKKMDGVGYHDDNKQDDMRHEDPPLTLRDAHLQEQAETPFHFW